MKILLTGAKGQLGRVLHQLLPAIGPVTAVDRDEVDFSDKDALHSLLQIEKPTLIVNAAAFTDVDGAETTPDLANAVNGTAPEVIAAWAAANGAAMFHYSTDYVFDGSGKAPWKESDPTNPINAYGESKRRGDEAVLASGAAFLVMRTSWVYAAHGQNFLRTMLRLGSERSELRVVADQIGAPTSANLLADTTVEIIRSATDDLPTLLNARGGIVNVTPSGETSWHGFAEAIFTSARQRDMPLQIQRVEPIPSSEYPLPATRPLNSRLALETVRDKFGMVMPSWQETLESVLDEVVSRTRL